MIGGKIIKLEDAHSFGSSSLTENSDLENRESFVNSGSFITFWKGQGLGCVKTGLKENFLIFVRGFC